MLDGLCGRLVAGGVPLWRAATGAELLHPLLDARGCRWLRGQGIVKEDYSRDDSDFREDEEWLKSPFYVLAHAPGDGELRRRLDGSYQRGEFPLLDRFQDEGSTDYLAFAVSYSGRLQFGELQGLLCSFQTDRPGGFDDAEIELLRRVATVLALAIKSIIAVETAGTLMATYLGEDAGRRVMAGAINRGVAETVRAVLWYSDLEGFTRIADHEPAPELIGLLNDYAEAVVGSVHAHGGQVLKFVGDGILGHVPAADGVMPCGRALDAAAGAIAAAQRLSAERVAAGRTGHRDACGPARRRRALRQHRQPRPAGLHRGRPGGERGGADRDLVPLARAAGDRLLGLRPRRRHGPRSPGLARPLRAQGRAPARGAVHARPRLVIAAKRAASRPEPSALRRLNSSQKAIARLTRFQPMPLRKAAA